MKKKNLVKLIILIIIIIGIVFIVKKVKNSKIDYQIAQVNTYTYFQYLENDNYGVIDKDGNKIIQAEYKKVVIPNPEKDVFVCYDENDNTKVFNAKMEEILTKYENVEPIKLKNVANILCYEKSVLKYQKDGKYGIIDFEGKEITKNIYDSIENLQGVEGKFIVSKNNKYGVININGKKIVDTNYDSVKNDDYYTGEENNVKSGFIVSNTTSDGYKYGYIDYKGKKILDAKYNEIIRIAELDEVYLIVSNNGQYGLYKNSKEIIKPEYQSIVYDSNGFLILQKNKNYGVADLEGNIKINVDYTNIETRGIYIYASNLNENAVYDKNGNKIDMNFNRSVYNTDNEDYRISTIVNNDITYYGIENKDGVALINESYKYLEYAYGDYFIAKNDKGNLGVINANGKILIDFKYVSIQTIKDKNMIQALNSKNDKTYIYSANLEEICNLKDANVDNEQDYIKIYNKKTEKYFDNDGNEIDANSDIVKNSDVDILPDNIGDYVKTQYSLDNVYYIKK